MPVFRIKYAGEVKEKDGKHAEGFHSFQKNKTLFPRINSFRHKYGCRVDENNTEFLGLDIACRVFTRINEEFYNYIKYWTNFFHLPQEVTFAPWKNC